MQRAVDERDVARVLDLRHHDAVEHVTCPGDHLAQVVESELAGDLVDPHHAHLPLPVVAAQRLHDLGSRRGLLERGAGVLEVEEHLVGSAGSRLLHHPWVAARAGNYTTHGNA